MSAVTFCFDNEQLQAAWAAYEQAALKNAGPAERARQRRTMEKFMSHPATHKLRINWARQQAGAKPEPTPIATADLDAVQTVAFNDPPRGRAVFSAEYARQAIRAAALATPAPPIVEPSIEVRPAEPKPALPPQPADPFDPT